MPDPPADSEAATSADTWTPPVPELVEVPADLPVLEPSHVISLPLNEQITSAVVVPDEHNGSDVLYVAVSQERVNVWAAVVYFVPEIALGVTGVLILVALRKWWVGRRFLHRKGEAYCRKCWAGLTGVESATCPECGRKVAKTKRIAKRSRRSPLSPRWVWPAVALLATLGTATIWFGEGWHTAYRYGMDPRDYYTRRQLYNYADRDSIFRFRINPMAGWFQWYSPRLSAFARYHNFQWLDTMSNKYKKGEYARYRMLIRLYTTDDGRLIDEIPLTADSARQNNHENRGIMLVSISDMPFVTDADCFYRLRLGEDDPWLKYEPPGPDYFLTDIGVTRNGIHLIIAYHRHDPATGKMMSEQCVVAYDVDTGSAVAALNLNQHSIPHALDGPELRQAAHTTVTDTVLSSIFIPAHDSRVLLYFDELNDIPQHPSVIAWDFLEGSIHPEVSWTYADIGLEFLIGQYYTWTVSSINEYDESYWGTYKATCLLEPDERFQLWTTGRQGMGYAIGSLPLNHRPLWSHQGTYPQPYDRYDPLTCLPLYDFDSATSHTQPSRILEFDHPHGQEQVAVTLSRSGERGIAHVGVNGPLLLVDIENAKALAHVSYGIDGFINGEFFVNDGRQLIDHHMSPHPPFPAQQTSYRHELLIFDVP